MMMKKKTDNEHQDKSDAAGDYKINPVPAEPGYVLPLQTV